MRTEQHDRETCQGKIAYASRQEAEDAGYRSRRVGKRLDVYKCDVCGCWHLTKSTGVSAKQSHSPL